MKKLLCLLLACGLVTGTGSAADTVSFNRVKLADPKGTQTDAQLQLNDADRKIVVRVAGSDFLVIPYETLDKASYEYSKKHRITPGAIVMVASLAAGGIVMLTKSKSHWLYLDFHEGQIPKTVVLRMHKDDYKQILEAVKTHTGKEIVYVGEEPKKNASKSSKADDKKPEDQKDVKKP